MFSFYSEILFGLKDCIVNESLNTYNVSDNRSTFLPMKGSVMILIPI